MINDLFPTNRDITLIEMTKGLMTGESGATKSLLTRRMMEKGVKIELNSKITYVDENTIKYEKNHQKTFGASSRTGSFGRHWNA